MNRRMKGRKTFPERLAELEAKHGPDGCWLWPGWTNYMGYARVSVYRDPTDRTKGQRQVQAHRRAYELMVGPITDGMVLDHICRVRRCINPRHLRQLTRRSNVLTAVYQDGRTRADEDHCVNGHAYTPENTRFVRICLTCRNATKVRSYHRHHSA